MAQFDVVVLGLGAMGSATAYHLARRGRRVLGLEQFTPAHDRGASHGHSRIIREAYFEDPRYVPLLQRAYELWDALQQQAGSRLLVLTGGLMIGPEGGELVQGTLASARQHHLSYELLSSADLKHRFPQFATDESTVAVWERRAGALFPEDCIRAHLTQAARAGAILHFEEPVQRWRVLGDGVEVTTSRGTYAAGHLIITAGPWAGQMLQQRGVPLEVERNVMYWFRPRQDGPFTPDRFPIYIYEYTQGRFFYGFPALRGEGVKIAHHHSGDLCTPETIKREVSEDEIQRIRALLARHIPDANGELLHTATCMYTNTPDYHFIIDRHPDHPAVTIACGFSGHGFKFSSVVGEILAELAEYDHTRHDIDLFSLARFASPV
jgi:sarcosine oxidase